MSHFDEDDPSYRCCCGLCHTRSAAIKVGLLELIFAGYKLGSILYELTVLAFWSKSTTEETKRYRLSQTLESQVRSTQFMGIY